MPLCQENSLNIGRDLQQIHHIATFLRLWYEEKQAEIVGIPEQKSSNKEDDSAMPEKEFFSFSLMEQLNQAYHKAPELLSYQMKILLDECIAMAQIGIEVLIKARQTGADPAIAAGSLASALERDVRRMRLLLLPETPSRICD
ncbi:hypothetical protein [Zymomonas mobilis]|uniref:Uncharacterized protein n=1 Tax=Zymomonas mobilis subsp. pomaceae (strain ATCC 29192 / DSM 22645 / JCM 10191 / CCUG 17912 / NBRC 13757 / NCIMB 11200 / NRRL B-4491 / Barker I) TaxID=579138 RepID=F8EWA2_ZYMMT|nr:hypothetical protein [Zymomonas mobilis]AEI38512.1 hypothetical protein Zymop_1623 [Zymomonas mobilis subsp. pomaceae ATCC 29192]MDX5948201.1 hypothetical protein [Zymomonas mobilis subsp. pomaceae]GEB88958.1 hypothetical protein ZMO02_05950 [Zymomonas mobilis subsp. pomaceae]